MAQHLASLRLVDAYRERIDATRVRTDALLQRIFDSVPHREFPERAATILGEAQLEAIRASAGFLSAFLSSEFARPLAGPPPHRELAGLTRDGRPLAEAYDAPSIALWTKLSEGENVDDAVAAGRLRLSRMVEWDYMHSARESLRRGFEDDERIVGWRRGIKGTCAKCMGDVEVAVSVELPPVSLHVHPNCKCVTIPVVRGTRDRFLEQDGLDRWNAMTMSEQDKMVGQSAATAIRKGYCTMDDLVQRLPDGTLKMRSLDDVLSAATRKQLAIDVRNHLRAMKAWRTRYAKAQRTEWAKKAWETRRANALARARANNPLLSEQLAQVPSPSGGGISSTFTGTLANGTKVQLKLPLDYPGIREGISEARGIYHAQASSRIADFLGIRCPSSVVRRADDLGERAIFQYADNVDDVGLTEWVPNFKPARDQVRLMRATPDESQTMHVLDYIIGNTDRHHGNFGWDDAGNLWAIDHDLTFPVGKSGWGNATVAQLGWGDRGIETLVGKPLSPKLKAKVGDMYAKRAEWAQRLKDDGLSGPEIHSWLQRLRKQHTSGKYLSPDDYMDGPHYWPLEVK
jgi:hypothetical protein